MALTPAEQHHKNTYDELQRVIGESEHVHNWVGIDYTETDRQQAAAKLDAAMQRNDSAWNAVQTERYGPQVTSEWTPAQSDTAAQGRAR